MSNKEFEAKLREGMALVHRRLVEQKRKTNTPFVFSENGVVKYVDPFSVEI